MAIRWRSPPEIARPRSPTRVSKPFVKEERDGAAATAASLVAGMAEVASYSAGTVGLSAVLRLPSSSTLRSPGPTADMPLELVRSPSMSALSKRAPRGPSSVPEGVLGASFTVRLVSSLAGVFTTGEPMSPPSRVGRAEALFESIILPVTVPARSIVRMPAVVSGPACCASFIEDPSSISETSWPSSPFTPASRAADTAAPPVAAAADVRGSMGIEAPP
mmetsp:Transcript_18498/g.55781  ORF Transcript_18498/g.55781 Transcript_18498/m.55781 type:complete len:219 (-) Transcript_18498:686-1342(-)